MRRLLLRWILLALSVWVASYTTQALGLAFKVDTDDFPGVLRFLFGVAALALLNATLGRVLKFLTIPLNCLTLGLFSFVINALILWLAASLELGLSIDGPPLKQFAAAFVGSLLISFINGILGTFLQDEPAERKGD